MVGFAIAGRDVAVTIAKVSNMTAAIPAAAKAIAWLIVRFGIDKLPLVNDLCFALRGVEPRHFTVSGWRGIGYSTEAWCFLKLPPGQIRTTNR
jgi:hypothetical protein